MKVTGILVIILSIAPISMRAQDPHQFDQEIERFDSISVPEHESVVVFTGSSSIRLWSDVTTDCHDSHVVNTGFGGSQMSDLLFFLEETILCFLPKEVYIYEGDNDIAEGKDPKAILETARQIVERIHAYDSSTQIHFISAKPSPSRWQYKDQYKIFNKMLQFFCDTRQNVFYIDVWEPMINDLGRAKPEIFIADSLHMNADGYDIWREVICTGGK